MSTLLKTIVIAIFCLYSSGIFAQTKKLPYHSIVKLNIGSAVDMITFPTIQFSYERRISKSISLVGEFGYHFYQIGQSRVDTNRGTFSGQFTFNSDTGFVSPTGFKSFFELRYYILRRKKRSIDLSFYTAANFFYRQHKTDVAMIYLKDSLNTTVDCYWMKRTNWGAMQMFGIQMRYKKFVFEACTGIGVSNRTVNDHNREYDIDKDYFERNRHDFIGRNRAYLSDYNEGTVGLSASLRVGMVIK